MDASDKIFESHNPWPGPISYQDPEKCEHVLRFCGRDNEIYDVTKLIDDCFFVTLYGKSGIGKTSLLNAGVFPQIRSMQYVPISIRLLYVPENCSFSKSVIDNIESAIYKKSGSIEEYNVLEKSTDENEETYLWNYFARHRFYTKVGDIVFPVVVFDQFEEVLRKKETRQRAENLLNQIAYMVDENHAIADCYIDDKEYVYDFNFRFVVSIREDDLYRLEDSLDNLFLPSLKQNRYRLRSLSQEEARNIITTPCPGLFAPNDVDETIKLLTEERDDGFSVVNPALLSLYLYLWFEQRGKVTSGGLFARYYKIATEDIDSKTLAYIEDHLISDNGYRIPMTLADMQSNVQSGVISTLIKNKLVQIEKRNGLEFIEFSHDRLCAEAKLNRDNRYANIKNKQFRKRILWVIGAMIPIIYIIWLIANDFTNKAYISHIEAQKDSIQIQKEMLENHNKLAIAQKDSINLLNDSLQKEMATIASQKKSIEESYRKLESEIAKNQAQEKIIEEYQRIVCYNCRGRRVINNTPCPICKGKGLTEMRHTLTIGESQMLEMDIK